MKKSSFFARGLCETMDVCVPLESSSYTLCRVFGCFEIDTGAAMTIFRFASISHARLFSTSQTFSRLRSLLEMRRNSRMARIVAAVVVILVIFFLWSHLRGGNDNVAAAPHEASTEAAVTATPGSFAYLSVCTNVKTLTAVLVQMALLKKFESRHPYVVLVSEKLPTWAKEVLLARGAELFVGKAVPYRFIGAPAYARGKWREAVVKLRMFQLTQYEKIVFLDADVLVQANVDDLFDLALSDEIEIRGMQDLHDCMEEGSLKHLNTGVLVFSPSINSWTRLMKNYENAPRRQNWMSDQDLIADTFAQTTALLPEASATMFVQCACRRNLSNHRLVHGAGMLNTDSFSLFGMQCTGNGVLDCATAQYQLWVTTYKQECDSLKSNNADLHTQLVSVGLCDIQPWPGADQAWKKAKALEAL